MRPTNPRYSLFPPTDLRFKTLKNPTLTTTHRRCYDPPPAMKFFGRGSSDDATATASPSTPNFSSSAAVASGPARPIRLVYCDEKGKFQMDPEAVSVLQLVKEPVGVVSVCGRARQGKSFILNQVPFIFLQDRFRVWNLLLAGISVVIDFEARVFSGNVAYEIG